MFAQPKGPRHLHPELVLAHRLRANHVIQADQIFFEHFEQQAGRLIDEHWAKDDIRKSVDLFSFAQVVDEELAKTAFCA